MTATRYHPDDLFLEWVRYGEMRPQRALPKGAALMCAGTDQRGMNNQEPCKYHGKGEGEFPLCGNHARRRGIFVVPSARLA